MFRRDAIEAVGLFDESLVRNQDYELNYRLRRAGGMVWFDPELRVGYRPRGSVRALARQFGEYGRWKRVVLRMHPRSLRWRHLVAPATTVAVVVGLLVGICWPLALVAPVGYAATVVVGSAVVGRGPATAARLMLVYPTMHLSWGVGFLWGLVAHSGRNGGSGTSAQAS